MSARREETEVVIIGAGVAGLTLATFLRKVGVAAVALERRGRAYVETRQRAGVVEARGVRMFERWGLADRLLGGPVAQTIDYRINGLSRVFEAVADGGSQGRFCTQQMLVNNLLRELIDVMAGDVRFGATDVTIQNDEGQPPRVAYRDGSGSHALVCDYIVGCDAEHGVSRASIPDGVLTRYSHEFGYAWLAALVEAPVTGHPIMGISDHGFVAQLPRGPRRSRYYLQCALGDGPEDWPDARIWDEIRLRSATIRSRIRSSMTKISFPLRAVVHAPMQYRNLFLAGDAAHLLPPTGAKGMNLALYDVDVLAQALRSAVRDHDKTALENYSRSVLPISGDTRSSAPGRSVLPHIWRYQEFSAWMTDTMHDAGDPAQHANFAR